MKLNIITERKQSKFGNDAWIKTGILKGNTLSKEKCNNASSKKGNKENIKLCGSELRNEARLFKTNSACEKVQGHKHSETKRGILQVASKSATDWK